jgi:hypothetical protein
MVVQTKQERARRIVASLNTGSVKAAEKQEWHRAAQVKALRRVVELRNVMHTMDALAGELGEHVPASIIPDGLAEMVSVAVVEMVAAAQAEGWISGVTSDSNGLLDVV